MNKKQTVAERLEMIISSGWFKDGVRVVLDSKSANQCLEVTQQFIKQELKANDDKWRERIKNSKLNMDKGSGVLPNKKNKVRGFSNKRNDFPTPTTGVHLKQTLEERLIDIINKWHKYESYPPIRPLVKKIVEELKANDDAWRKRIEELIEKNKAYDFGIYDYEGIALDLINLLKEKTNENN